MPLEMGNGIISWLLVSAVINLLFFILWKKANPTVSLQEFGVLNNASIGLKSLVLRSLLLSTIAVGFLYILTCLVHVWLGVELRFLWPLLKPLTLERAELFIVYWLPILLFFFAFNGLIICVQMKQPLQKTFSVTLIRWSIKTVIFAVSGLLVLWLFHFIPDFMQIGPGFDFIGLPHFGGRWMMMLAVIIPQFIVFIIINHWCYLKTGYIYLGVFFTSMLMTWILVGGQVIGRFLV